MSDKKLIKWLRDFVGPGSNGTNQAADRIESLQAELAEWKQKAEDRLAAYNAKIQDFAQETRRTSALMAELAEAAAVIEQVRAWRDENQEHMVYEATDEEPAECTDECEWCPLDTILDAAPSSALDAVKHRASEDARLAIAQIRTIGANSGTDINAWNKAFDVIDEYERSQVRTSRAADLAEEMHARAAVLRETGANNG